jgi:hypothetical protein
VWRPIAVRDGGGFSDGDVGPKCAASAASMIGEAVRVVVWAKVEDHNGRLWCCGLCGRGRGYAQQRRCPRWRYDA